MSRTRIAIIILVIYFVGAFSTNSYIRLYRYSEWATPKDVAPGADLGVLFGTAFWPLYIGGCISDKVVEKVFTTKITIEKPEVMR